MFVYAQILPATTIGVVELLGNIWQNENSNSSKKKKISIE
jgi:hypothetical protein